MPCNPLTDSQGCLDEGAGGLTHALGTGVSSVASSAWESVGRSFAEAAVSLLTEFAEAFVAFPQIDPRDAGIRSVYGISLGIAAVAGRWEAHAGDDGPWPRAAGLVTGETSGAARPEAVFLYYNPKDTGAFECAAMFDDGAHGDGAADDGVFGAEIPPQPAGTRVRYYVEARASAQAGTTTFHPARAEFECLSYRVRARPRAGFPVRINETAAEAARGDDKAHRGWIELVNTSEAAVDLGGMYLSDDLENPRKWRFPAGAAVAPRGFLLIEAGEDAPAGTGLRADFKISTRGEALVLTDRDDCGNDELDRVVWGAISNGASWGRLPDGEGVFRPLVPTPGAENAAARAQ